MPPRQKKHGHSHGNGYFYGHTQVYSPAQGHGFSLSNANGYLYGHAQAYIPAQGHGFSTAMSMALALAIAHPNLDNSLKAY